jgi:SAM-dependent methyltransferase
MISSGGVRRSLLMLCLFLLVAGMSAQAAASEYEPRVGQDGKDVIWVPTCQDLVDTMLNMAKVTSKDYVIDLGSGDGRLVITAAKRGARALGIEYNPDMVALSKRLAAKEGLAEKVQFIQGDIFESDFSQATVITMFLMPEINLKLRPRILDLKPGTRIVSNSFTMGDWTPDDTAAVEPKEGCETYFTANFWIVPAKVEGTWMLPQGELTLKQSFQDISGTLKSARNTTPVTGKLRGDVITFSSGPAKYIGRVSGNTLEGTFESGGKAVRSNATRVGKAL